MKIIGYDRITVEPDQIEFLINHLSELENELKKGSVITIRSNRVRARKLPLF